MDMKRVAAWFALFLLGTAAGFGGKTILDSRRGQHHHKRYIEKRLGRVGLTNPLLGCDAAEDVLRDSDLPMFRNRVEKLLNQDISRLWASRVSVYFRELNDGTWFGIGDMDKFTPASLRKLPLMIAILKQAEKDRGFMERMVLFDLANDYNQSQNIQPREKLTRGKSYSVRELVERMIIFSDNNAFTLLTKVVNPVEFDNTYVTLRMQNPGALDDDQFLSVQTYESFFRALYNASYLTKESSEWALELLSKTDFTAGIPEGVPKGVVVSHKFGEKSDMAAGTVQLHDCGIVYHPNTPYLLCVMSEGRDIQLLDDVIRDVSKFIYSEVDSHTKNPSR